MYLPREAIEQFRANWLQEYGEDLPYKEAVIQAEQFLSGMYDLIRISLKMRERNQPVE
jgi:hypothetical protein